MDCLKDKKILVIGGAGYIGSHTVMQLRSLGCKVVIVDNLSTGHNIFLQGCEAYILDLADTSGLQQVFNEHSFDGVIHFAASAYVGESVIEPAKYYRNNVLNTLSLLSFLREFSVKNLIFSSSCAVYGEPQHLPLREDHPKNPINPYGRTKLAVEWMLADFDTAYGIPYTVLRYFNAAGASFDASIGEWHEPETHLIPLVLQAALDPKKKVKVLGVDYKTHDGSCIRDYVHVVDLAQAHIQALARLLSGEASAIYNLSNQQGFSVKEVISCAQSISNSKINVEYSERRAGDPAVLVGDATLAHKELGWYPRVDTLEAIIESAWAWERKKSILSDI